MAEEIIIIHHLPEDIIVNILSRLPLKPLIRFAAVSKRWRFIILSDPHFAASQFLRQRKPLRHRLLVSTDSTPQFHSLDLETTSFGDDNDSVRKLPARPFQLLPDCAVASLLGSCNGLVFVLFESKSFVICNPSTGAFNYLPDPGIYSADKCIAYQAVGHLSAADDYKVVVGYLYFAESCAGAEYTTLEAAVEMFSLRGNKWKTIKARSYFDISYHGIVLNQALHWIDHAAPGDIVAFDLGEEEFKTMQLPNFEGDGKYFTHLGVGACGGGGKSLCVSRYPEGASGFVDFWVMGEYGVRESWCKMFTMRVPEMPERLYHGAPCLVMENCTVVEKQKGNVIELIKIVHKEGEKIGVYRMSGERVHIIPYEESLLWIE